ncbi:MAG: hypothetical protein KAJ06_12120 [Gammaproteobacteria bacterium]|nr:hypothetical protein [Gammaproteobacteria bacterium]
MKQYLYTWCRSAIYCANNASTGSRNKLRSYALLILMYLAATTPAAAAETMQLEGATITGNQELPKALHIVPWKPSSAGDLSGRPMNSLIDEAPEPIDRDVFLREMDYYDAVHSIE